MGQDSLKCAKCGELCGYDDDKGRWDGANLAICGRCKRNLSNRFCAFFGLDASSTEFGIEVEWQEADRILSRIVKDYPMRTMYIVTEKDYYEATYKQRMPIEKE